MLIIISLLILIVAIVLIGSFIVFNNKSKIELSEKLDFFNSQTNENFIKQMELFVKLSQQEKKEQIDKTISVVDPISKTLERLHRNIDDLEKIRSNRENNLNLNISKLIDLQNDIKKETNKMMNVFKKPNTRGRWGEIQLQKIAELSGMLPFCEFSTQYSDLDGIRPDMVVRLPNDGFIFVDAKTPLEAYNKLLEEDSDIEVIKKENLKAIKNHIYSLSNKKYWSKTEKAPDFVIMFIPLESTWLSALEEEPELMDYTVNKNVIVATPMTLIALLKTICLGWKQVKFADEADTLKKSLAEIENYIKLLENLFLDIQKKNIQAGDKICNSINIINNLKKETSKYSQLKPIDQGSVFIEEEEVNYQTNEIKSNEEKISATVVEELEEKKQSQEDDEEYINNNQNEDLLSLKEKLSKLLQRNSN